MSDLCYLRKPRLSLESAIFCKINTPIRSTFFHFFRNFCGAIATLLHLFYTLRDVCLGFQSQMICPFYFQSILDFSASSLLLLVTVTVRDAYLIHSSGIFGSIECRLWNTEFLLWGLFLSSTWNIVSLTFERSMFSIFTLLNCHLLKKLVLKTVADPWFPRGRG